MSLNALAGLKLGAVMALGIISFVPAADAGLITAMRSSQSLDESDPIARLERDGIARGYPAAAERSRRYWHNGSIVEALYSPDGAVRISYVEPKPELADLRGMTLFEGRTERGGRIFGTAYTFKFGCAPAPYQVSGGAGPTGMTLSGASPRRDPYSCAVAGYTFRSPNVRLNFIDLTLASR
jgi:hypothetical protein